MISVVVEAPTLSSFVLDSSWSWKFEAPWKIPFMVNGTCGAQDVLEDSWGSNMMVQYFQYGAILSCTSIPQKIIDGSCQRESGGPDQPGAFAHSLFK